jgi:hypothetical protein
MRASVTHDRGSSRVMFRIVSESDSESLVMEILHSTHPELTATWDQGGTGYWELKVEVSKERK